MPDVAVVPLVAERVRESVVEELIDGDPLTEP